MIKFDAEDQSWEQFNSEEEFHAAYPPCKYGQYRPQPFYVPEKYPCLAYEVAVVDNPTGADHAVICFIYDFEIV